MVFIGMLIGGVVPFLFSSMLIRAVGRAAFLIVKECRIQFRDKEIWAGTKKPDYGRVVNICTAAAQDELIGPGLLAILMPILVGIFLGTQALGGFLAGMIVVGQLLAVFMANAGGAWDNAKKTDRGRHLRRQGLRGAQGGRHRRHRRRPAEGHRRPGPQPADQGHEHGRPAGHRADPRPDAAASPGLYLVGLIGIAAVAWAVWRSKTESKELREMEAELGGREGRSEPGARRPLMLRTEHETHPTARRRVRFRASVRGVVSFQQGPLALEPGHAVLGPGREAKDGDPLGVEARLVGADGPDRPRGVLEHHGVMIARPEPILQDDRRSPQPVEPFGRLLPLVIAQATDNRRRGRETVTLGTSLSGSSPFGPGPPGTRAETSSARLRPSRPRLPPPWRLSARKSR